MRYMAKDWSAFSCAPSGSSVSSTGTPATTRGAARPAACAAARTPGPTSSASVRGPVIHVMVPSQMPPATFRMSGPSAPIRTGGGGSQAPATLPRTR